MANSSFPSTNAMGHEHKFKTTIHADGCHWYMTQGVCACRAAISVTHERDLANDVWSLVWAEPTSYELVNRDAHGRYCTPHEVERRCDRCDQLLQGASPRRTVVIVGADGKIESETTHAAT